MVESNTRGYVSRYGTLSEQCTFGARMWGCLKQEFIICKFAHRMTGCRFLAWFLCPSALSRANTKHAFELGDSDWYPAVFCDLGQPEHVHMARLHIVLLNSKPWCVHRSRRVDKIEF
jgi:hypothetical protein